MSHFRTHLVNTPEQLARLISLADHSNLRILFDTYHVVTEVRDYAAALRQASRWLYALHACESDRGVPGGGLVPWESVFTTLLELGFEGYVGLETYNSGIGDFACHRGMFHNVCPDATDFVRRGIRFLQETEQRCRQHVRRSRTEISNI
jgi:D-psicose/D-tagatose/L-ribulose 3-epimerase